MKKTVAVLLMACALTTSMFAAKKKVEKLPSFLLEYGLKNKIYVVKLLWTFIIYEVFMKAIFYNLKLRTRINLRMLRNIILFLLLIWLTFFMIFKDQDMNELIRLIKVELIRLNHILPI